MSTNSGESFQSTQNSIKKERTSKKRTSIQEKGVLIPSNQSVVQKKDSNIEMAKKQSFGKFSHKKAQNQFKKFKNKNKDSIIEIKKLNEFKKNKKSTIETKENNKSTPKPKIALKKFSKRTDTPKKQITNFRNSKKSTNIKNNRVSNNDEYYSLIKEKSKSSKKKNGTKMKFGSYVKETKTRIKIPRSSHQEYTPNLGITNKMPKKTFSEKKINFQGFIQKSHSKGPLKKTQNKSVKSRKKIDKYQDNEKNKTFSNSKQINLKTKESLNKMENNKQKIKNLRILMESIGTMPPNKKANTDRGTRYKY
jgi:hypothetical protein